MKSIEIDNMPTSRSTKQKTTRKYRSTWGHGSETTRRNGRLTKPFGTHWARVVCKNNHAIAELLKLKLIIPTTLNRSMSSGCVPYIIGGFTLSIRRIKCQIWESFDRWFSLSVRVNPMGNVGGFVTSFSSMVRAGCSGQTTRRGLHIERCQASVHGY